MKFLRFVLNGFLFVIIIIIIVAIIQIIVQGWGFLIVSFQKIVPLPVPILSIVTIFIFIIIGNFIYNAISKVIKVFLTSKIISSKNKQGKVVMFKPAEQGAYEIGVVTSEFDVFLVVFTPTFPSIFTGPVRIIEKEKVIELKILPQDLINFVLTAGAINPLKNIKIDIIEEEETGGK